MCFRRVHLHVAWLYKFYGLIVWCAAVVDGHGPVCCVQKVILRVCALTPEVLVARALALLVDVIWHPVVDGCGFGAQWQCMRSLCQ